MSKTRVLATVCIVALGVFALAIASCHFAQQSQISDEFDRRHRDHRDRDRSLRTILVNHEELRDKFVVFLDIDGVIAPYGLDPKDDDADDDVSHFSHDDDKESKLQAHHCWRPFTNETMTAFSSILEAIPEGKRRVVLSSFWRVHSDCRMAILDSFRAYGDAHGGPLKDFRWFDDRTGEIVGDRQVEIVQWLQLFNPKNKVLAGWLVLDDAEVFSNQDRQGFRRIFQGHFVQPNEDTGLTSEDVAKAIELIQRQLSQA